MSGLTSAIDIALSGLQLYEAGINTVSNNLANATTAGYAVESVNAQTAVANGVGDGVTSASITRAATGFAASQLRGANAASSAASTQSTVLTAISDALTNNGNIQTTLNQFFQGLSTLASSPTSTAQRQTVLSNANTVVASFQSASTSLTSATQSAQSALSSGLSSANGLLGQLQQLNTALTQSPNNASLLDQQQAALNTLSQLLPVNTLPQSNGSVIVTSGGTVLLDQSGVQTLNAGNTQVTAGTNNVPVTLTAADGTLGGSLANITAGNAALQALGGVAAVVAAQVNTAQAEGLDGNGNPGTNLFSVPSPSVTANSSNTGGASLTASLTSPAALPADGGPFTLTYATSTGWSATDNASGQNSPVSGTPPSFAGLTLAVTGTPANGDSFTVNPAPDAASGISVVPSLASAVAAADPYVATPGILQSNGSYSNANAGTITTGTDTVTSSPSSAAAIIPASYYGQSLQLTFTSPTAYNVTTTLDTGTVIASGTLGSAGGALAVGYPSTGAAAGNYWQLPISGAPDTGDVLTLTPGGTSSGSNAQRMGTLWSGTTGTSSAGTLEQAVVGLSTGLGENAQAAQTLSTATASQVTTATTNLSTIAGVNTDQQAVVLVNYQQAYQAAAQAISAAHTMFTSLLSAI